MSAAQKALGISCPSGSRFYVYKDNPDQFMGCCNVDACEAKDGVCPTGKLAATTFEKYFYAMIPQQSCFSDNSAVSWYTCAYTDPPFMGCCSEGACKSGCAADKLEAAKLSDNKDDAAVFLSDTSSSSTSTTSSSSMASTSASATEAASTSISTTPTPTHTSIIDTKDGGGLAKGAIAGILVAAVIAVLLVLGLAFLWRKRGVQKSQEEAERSMRARYESHTRALQNYHEPSWESSPSTNLSSHATPLERHRSPPGEQWQPAPDYYSLEGIVRPADRMDTPRPVQSEQSTQSTLQIQSIQQELPVKHGQPAQQAYSVHQPHSMQPTQLRQPTQTMMQHPPNWQTVKSVVELRPGVPSNRYTDHKEHPVELGMDPTGERRERDCEVPGLMIPRRDSPVLPAELEDSSPPPLRTAP